MLYCPYDSRRIDWWILKIVKLFTNIFNVIMDCIRKEKGKKDVRTISAKEREKNYTS
jgi:hypothetical protein